jgi:hypothetical protein
MVAHGSLRGRRANQARVAHLGFTGDVEARGGRSGSDADISCGVEARDLGVLSQDPNARGGS